MIANAQINAVVYVLSYVLGVVFCFLLWPQKPKLSEKLGLRINKKMLQRWGGNKQGKNRSYSKVQDLMVLKTQQFLPPPSLVYFVFLPSRLQC